MNKIAITLMSMLVACSATAAQPEWQPIETAPKDGSLVLISAGVDYIDRTGIIIGKPENRVPAFMRWTYIAAWYDGAWHDGSSHQRLPWEAKKWMPVPKETQ